MPKKREMEHKQFEAVITGVDEAQGIVTTIFAVMGNVDEGFDRVHPGSFTKTFSERGHKVIVLDNHNANSTGDVVAKPVSFRELRQDELPQTLLDRVPDATGGAEMIAKFEPDKDKDAASAAAFYRIKNEWVSEWSFGYDALDFDFTTEMIGAKEVQVRNLRTIKLYEVSPVLWGMNSATMTTDAKSQPSDDKPWRVVPQGGQFCVFALDEDSKPTGEPLKCYDNEEEAGDYMRALYANVEDAGKANPLILSTKNLDRVEELLTELRDILSGDFEIVVKDDEKDKSEEEAPPPEAADEAGPDDEPPTTETDTLLQLIDIEIEEMEVLNV